jgi:hypothetical protein
MRCWWGCAPALASLVFVAGCGSSQEVSVAGQVRLNGEPLPDVAVTATSSDGSRTATAVTNAAGAFELHIRAFDDGTVPRDYKVTVVPYEPPEVVAERNKRLSDPSMDPRTRANLGEPPPVGTAFRPPGSGAAATQAGPSPRTPPQPLAFPTAPGIPVPRPYTSLQTTPLRLQVPPEGPVVFDLNNSGT